jgi:hypothetical protein
MGSQEQSPDRRRALGQPAPPNASATVPSATVPTAAAPKRCVASVALASGGLATGGLLRQARER